MLALSNTIARKLLVDAKTVLTRGTPWQAARHRIPAAQDEWDGWDHPIGLPKGAVVSRGQRNWAWPKVTILAHPACQWRIVGTVLTVIASALVVLLRAGHIGGID